MQRRSCRGGSLCWGIATALIGSNSFGGDHGPPGFPAHIECPWRPRSDELSGSSCTPRSLVVIAVSESSLRRIVDTTHFTCVRTAKACAIEGTPTGDKVDLGHVADLCSRSTSF